MTDRFSHPLSIQPTTTSSQRSRQSPSRASISSRASASQPAGRVDRTRTDRSRQPETTFLSPQVEQDARSYKTQTRSRASTTSRSRIPEALQGVGREELDIYLVRWDLLGDDELARACGVHSSSSTSTSTAIAMIPGSSSTSPSAFTRTQPRTPSPSTSTSNPYQDANLNAPRLTRSSSSLSSLQTPKPRPRPLKRLSTQILALTLPPSENDTIGRENLAFSSTSTSTSYQDRRAEGLFPPSPPGDRPDFEFGSLQHEDQGQDHDQDQDHRNLKATASESVPARPTNDVAVDPGLHPLRVLSRLTRELGEACLRLEEENRELRLRSLTQEEELRLGPAGSRDVAGGVVTPRKGSTGVNVEPRSGFGVEDRGDGTDDVIQRGIEVESNEADRDPRLSSVFREEDQVSSQRYPYYPNFDCRRGEKLIV
jgi:hypothetical protein